MNSNDIKLRFLKVTNDRTIINIESISNIIDSIKENGSVSNLVNSIRKSTSIEAKKRLKLRLPAFFPNLLFLDGDTNSTIRPSGIIGFDIDLQDNSDDFDIVKLKQEIISIPSCFYAYISPSGGLKFAIKTDFTDLDGEESTKPRFKAAYNLTLEYLLDNIHTEFICDKSSASIMQTSFISNDPQAFINIDCDIYRINDQCVYIPNVLSISTEPRQDSEYILELLKYIPKLSYNERLPINYSVFQCLGSSGKSILIDHWVQTGIPLSKIKPQIESQSKNIKFGSIGCLVNAAKRYGYEKIVTGRARNKLRAKKSEIQLKSLLTPEEGTAKLSEIVKDFFTQNHNVFVNVSAGGGKSSAVLNVLAKDIPYNKKILFLVPSHALADELEKKFKVARNNPELNEFEKKHGLGESIQDKEFDSMILHLKTFKKPISGIVHLKGKNKLCVNESARNEFDGVSNIPMKYCSTCFYVSECGYIKQFQNRFDNIRIMTHNEWMNNQSAWFNGYEEKYGRYKKIKGDFVRIKDEFVLANRSTKNDSFVSVVINGKNIPIIDGKIKLNDEFLDICGEYIEEDGKFLDVTNEYLEESGDIYPSDIKWIPDYIIIDENIISVALEKIKSDDGNKHQSIRKIINTVNNGKSLSEAIDENIHLLFIDNVENTKPKFPTFDNDIPKYCNLLSARKDQLKSYSEILEHLIDYLKTKDQNYLQGMWVADNKIHFAPVSQASQHYQNIPTLFLDATANAEVVQATLGNLKFHSIAIQSKNDINLYQLANFTVTKSYVNEADNRTKLVSWIKTIINKGQYDKVGIITYLKAEGINCNFDEFLAAETGAAVHGHFGAIRGIDKFDDVDCLLIVGRHFIGTDSTSRISAAIFGEIEEYETILADMPVRMKDGSKYFVNSGSQVNGKHLAINEHFSLAETKQAIGRSRAIHGNKKDVYIFSNESLGLDIEVTDFFYRECEDSVTCSDDVIQRIKSIGYVLNTPKALLDMGLNKNDIKSRREELIEKLAEKEIILMKCNMVDATYRKSVVEYFIADKSKFIVDEKFDNKKFKSFVIVENHILN
ncbi:BT4734/BF3469 family protein [Nitrosomonas supralitoralis]|uniref:BT4734-like N-terminal domain-containing protein n=1 Tax=Nitrosomonas supralitoralis TaxID=2116706 RepID=A0A2P7NV31_9PROT|nr:BT4734/BF3469 family protein [Nitrosomonas supralitoralis]PSJ17331.1 hypothetical protein C7H79_08535 [Nitrosomonas supralitoralis]